MAYRLERLLLKYVLEDDDTPTGGLDHAGETLGEFLAGIDEDIYNLTADLTLSKINSLLKECGIKPIGEGYTHFCADTDKMIDFCSLTKEEFLASYSYLTEDEYILTEAELRRRKRDCCSFLDVETWDMTTVREDHDEGHYYMGFTVPYQWAYNWIKLYLDPDSVYNSVTDFMENYTFDDTYCMYSNAMRDGVVTYWWLKED